MIVQACLNGARPRDFHPRLPVTVAAIVADAVEAVAAGAAELHLHVRGADGAESLAPAAVDATLAALRDRLPGTLIGISTGAWIEQDDDRRLAMIDGWRLLPDHASVNLGEAGAPAVVERLHRRGIGVEAGLASAADAERLVRLGLAPLALRILVEIEEQALDAAMASADAILAVLARAGIRKPVLLHGFDATVWPFVARAARQGFSARVGLEDGATLPDGTTAAANAALVAAAVAMMRRV
ncbi:3-keto-5-aminohexanoate cleavage protein [Benzoatithermus flavus]|uniref:3-keto-5-aminohexanoate cleavage protein n=1 Tax=Benzoatithermus flavus TaxID=3108223 RepID=A0ABU8XRN8_9PROT